MTSPDPVMTTVGEAIGLGRSGDRARARELLSRAWERVGVDGDPMHRVGIAHSMADVQDEPADELVWDLRALAAADELTDQRVAEVGIDTPVAGFYPSLHLNLGEVYRKLGRLEEARDHLRQRSGSHPRPAVVGRTTGRLSGHAHRRARTPRRTPRGRRRHRHLVAIKGLAYCWRFTSTCPTREREPWPLPFPTPTNLPHPRPPSMRCSRIGHFSTADWRPPGVTIPRWSAWRPLVERRKSSPGSRSRRRHCPRWWLR